MATPTVPLKLMFSSLFYILPSKCVDDMLLLLDPDVLVALIQNFPGFGIHLMRTSFYRKYVQKYLPLFFREHRDVSQCLTTITRQYLPEKFVYERLFRNILNGYCDWGRDVSTVKYADRDYYVDSFYKSRSTSIVFAGEYFSHKLFVQIISQIPEFRELALIEDLPYRITSDRLPFLLKMMMIFPQRLMDHKFFIITHLGGLVDLGKSFDEIEERLLEYHAAYQEQDQDQEPDQATTIAAGLDRDRMNIYHAFIPYYYPQDIVLDPDISGYTPNLTHDVRFHEFYMDDSVQEEDLERDGLQEWNDFMRYAGIIP